jgi:queuosine precursor transporter
VSALIYLAAITLANLTVAAFGPSVSIINAFWLIGLDLTIRDRLHERWQDDGLRWKMAGLIAIGGLISWVLNRDAGQIALASTVAFTVSAALDAVVFQLLEGHPRMVRINGSNVAGAIADSILFPTLAFGALLPVIVLGQLAAKVAGGFLWSLILAVPQWRRAS